MYELKVHFIDVGQGDSALVQLPSGQSVLIDAGDGGAAEKVVRYLHDQDITKIDHLIATHPHENHIGGMIYVLKQFPVGKVYMPKVGHTSRAYQTFLTTIQEQGLKITEAKAGVTLDMGAGITASFVAPNNDSYGNLNNYSAVLSLTYGATTFLFTGDAEALAESEMLLAQHDLASDVLKVGHHGCETSTTDGFLRAIFPSIAIISVGKGNDYGHPADSVLDRLESYGAKIYRTDRHGSIVVSSSGRTLSVATEKEPAGGEQTQPTPEPTGMQYIGNKNSGKFHLPTCSTLPIEKNRVYFNSREEAIAAGYDPCKNCKP